MSAPEVILDVQELVKHFPIRRSSDLVHAVNGVSFKLRAGETLALVGESGSGKTTVGRCVLKLTEATSGRLTFGGQDIAGLTRKAMRRLRPRMQMVFQEPYESLNPRFTINKIVSENLLLEGVLSAEERKTRVAEVLEMVQIQRLMLDAYPHELSAGEQQRVAIGRALATKPDLIVLDEPTSNLDISVRAGIIELLRQVQKETKVSYLFISHDLTAVREIAARVAIMYLGEIVELAPNPIVFDRQLHPYGKALMESVLLPDPRARVAPAGLKGEIPSPVHLPAGCQLHPRCMFAVSRCSLEKPAIQEYGGGRSAACHRVLELFLEDNEDDSSRIGVKRRE